MLKQNGYKVAWHLMPDLPGSSYEKDKSMIDDLFKIESQEEIGSNYIRYKLKNPDLQSDQLKIYPCTTVDWTEIKEWYDKGEYKPYSEDEEKLIELIIHIKKLVFPWIRLNRIIRDIPNIYILGGNENVNLIASSSETKYQIFKYKNHAYGIQFHIEVKKTTVGEWGCVPEYKSALEKQLGQGALEKFDEDSQKYMPTMNAYSEVLYENFKKLVK